MEIEENTKFSEEMKELEEMEKLVEICRIRENEERQKKIHNKILKEREKSEMIAKSRQTVPFAKNTAPKKGCKVEKLITQKYNSLAVSIESTSGKIEEYKHLNGSALQENKRSNLALPNGMLDQQTHMKSQI